MRVADRGLVDRRRPVTFTFDGRAVTGFAGDTVAAALLADGTRLMARSFKYHRPRGPWSAGAEEPNALVTVGRGGAQRPNIRATVEEIVDGLEVRSQNAWPSLRRDALAINDAGARFLSAGFYYKTFMWPRAFWERLYEPAIRRAAGLGALSGQADGLATEKAFAFCDLLVIGAGPTGLMAALRAGRAGADVILADETDRPGGRLLAEDETVAGMAGPDWVARVLEELSSLPGVRVMTRTTVTGAYDGGTFGALERAGPDAADGAPHETFWRIVAGASVLAAGALERGIAFRDNDRPGIMAAGAARTYLNRWGVAPGRSVAVFCNNDDAHRTARDMAAAGVRVAAVIDTRRGVTVAGDFPVYTGAQVIGTTGRLGLQSVRIRHVGGETDRWTAALAVSGGWNPNVALSCHMNGRPVWRDDIAAFVPAPDAVPGMVPAGAANGTFDTAGCLADGARAAGKALAALGIDAPEVEVPEAGRDAYRMEPVWRVPGAGRAWLDLQNDVTVKDVVLAAAENFRAVEHMKRYTTQGMATDQGKTSNVVALAVLADVTGRGIAETGTTTFRPPYTPVSIAAMGAGSTGAGFAPQRFTTAHAACVELGAPMIEAGLWYRPSYFARAGETTWRAACDREVAMVRQSVGVCDVSTLGKIDIQGPDAAALLDLVYANGFASLKVGRVRYGLMLREDGHVMDDGTTARLDAQHYLMTTTTAAAGAVMKHLDFVTQCLRPDLDVAAISVTEQWAQFAVTGPRSRDLVQALIDAPVTDAAWPFMACGPLRVLGVPGRLFRISFSGEHGYEVAVPARYGDALFRDLVRRAEAMGGGAYGMEALNVLRIEKGHITHAEIHGRTTAFDIGMGRMLSAKKDCIGATMAARPGLSGAGREQLVGLRPADGVGVIHAGAHLFNEGVRPVRVHAQGYVTSACHSPTVGHPLALAFLKGGRARHGERVAMVDHLRGVTTICIVGDPVVVDPEGGRLRG